MKTKEKSAKKIILAVDLNGEESKLIERIWPVVKPFLKKEGVVVEPVTVLNREDLATWGVLKNKIGSLRSAAERHLSEALSRMRIEGLAAPKVLFADGSSKQRAVDALLDYAKKTSCDLIAISTHSRIGMKRLFMGSFAETLSLQSSIPLMVVNPNQRTKGAKAQTVLFPTDFTSGSKEALRIVCESLPIGQPRIILFHALQYQNFLVPIPMQLGAPAMYPQPDEIYKAERNRVEAEAKEWVKELRSNGFGCTFILDEKSSTVAEGIYRAAFKYKVRMITMAGMTEKWGSRLLGSFAREVLRTAPCPVWMIHLSKKKKDVANNVLKFEKRQIESERKWAAQ